MLGLLLLVVIPTQAVLSESGQAPVKAVLFYGPDCGQCGELLDYYVPALLQRHGSRLEIAGVDVGQAQGRPVYRAAARKFGLPPRWRGEPILIVGRVSFSGLLAIGATLGDEFDRLVADPDALRWPDVLGLSLLLPGAVEDIRARAATTDPLPPLAADAPDDARVWANSIANALAVVALIGMILALGHSAHRVWRPVWRPSANTVWIVVVALVGLGISAYTAYTSLADVDPICGPVGDCATVQQSDYSRLFGIPMGVLGFVGYGAILVTWLLGRRLSPHGGGWRWLPWTIALVAVLFSLRLTALEPFVIGATCTWCLGSAVAITVLLWLLSGETRSGDSDPQAGE